MRQRWRMGLPRRIIPTVKQGERDVFSISSIGESFRSWMSKQSVLGAGIDWLDHYHAVISPGAIVAYVSFVPLFDGHEVVEMRIQRTPQSRPSFITHFILEDEWRARSLFREMAQALATETVRGPIKVLVCGSSRPELESAELAFTERLRQESEHLSVGYEFVLADATSSLVDRKDCVAVLLMPSVAALQHQEHLAHKSAVTFAIPKQALLSQDARATIRLLLEALGEVDTLASPIPPVPPIPPARMPSTCGEVLVINVMYCDRCVRMGWRVYRNLHKIATGKVTKGLLHFEDMDDLLGTLPLYGVDVQSLDAIELLVPGVVSPCSMNLPSLGDRDYCIAEKVWRKHGIPTFVENNTNAAAYGCYLLQDDYSNVALYRHQLGHMNGGQGTIVAGNVVHGRYGLAGEPKFYQRRFSYGESYSRQVWSAKGIEKICTNVALATIGIVEPDVLYFAVEALEDMESLRANIERSLPKYCAPQIVAIDDYRERMYLGGAALALQSLS